MRRLAIALLATTTLSAGLGQAAFAADLPLKARPAPFVAPVWNWSGFYAGVHVGAGWARKEWHAQSTPLCEFLVPSDGFCLSPAPSYLGSHNAIGPLAGGQIGFNVQSGPWVWGIEGQYSWAKLKGDHQDVFSTITEGCCSPPFDGFATASSRFASKINGIGTLALRLGITGVPSDRTLFYVKGGGAYVNEDFTENTTITAFDIGGPVGFDGFTTYSNAAKNVSRWGWMLGAGIELGLWDNWSAKVEYNYLGFGKKDVRLTRTDCFFGGKNFGNTCDLVPAYRDVRIEQDIQLIKFGLNYRFGGYGKGKAPVVAKY